MEAGTKIYHLDKDGYRDALVDPATGMAYIEEYCEDGTVRILVWPVNVRKDEFGNVLLVIRLRLPVLLRWAKIRTAMQRMKRWMWLNNSTAEIPDADKPSVYPYGVRPYYWNLEKEMGSNHTKRVALSRIRFKQDMNGSVLVDDNNGDFLRTQSSL